MKRLRFRRFALFTTALTGLLAALGVYTAATGAGLACSQQWPLCDNGLLPQTLPSFIEWFHRFVAMLVGFLIIGVVGWAWRGGADRKTATLATAALVLLPLQVSLGAITVTLNGAIPGGYSVPTQAAHLLVALSIFTLLTLATLSAYQGHFTRSADERVHLALVAALVLLVANLVVTRATPVVDYVPAAQGLFAVTALATVATLVGVAVWLPETSLASSRPVVLGAGVSMFLVTLLGRDLVTYTDTALLAHLALYAVTIALVGVLAWASHRGRADGRPSLT